MLVHSACDGTPVTDSLPHHDAMDVAAYTDGTMSPRARAKFESHLADCDLCRREVMEVAAIQRKAPVARRRRLLLPLGALAAAATLLFVLLPARPFSTPDENHRDPAFTVTVAPVAIEPFGQVAEVDAMRWSSVPEATRYHVRLFDAKGSVVWEGEATDTSVLLPNAVRLVPEEKYFWSVRAKTGWDRWVESPLTEFVIQSGAPDQ